MANGKLNLPATRLIILAAMLAWWPAASRYT